MDMELRQNNERTTYEVSAEQDGWNISASVTVKDGKVQNLDGNAMKDGVQMVNFNGWRNGENLTRSVHNVTDESADVYDTITAFFNAAVAKYESE